MQDEIEIRQIAFSDIYDVIPLACELNNLHNINMPAIFKKLDSVDKSIIEYEIENNDYFYIASSKNKIVGYIKGKNREVKDSIYTYERKIVTIIDLIVDKSYRNIGVGKKLLMQIENQAKANGIMNIEIPIYSYNDDAKRFYERNGYKTYVERRSKKIE